MYARALTLSAQVAASKPTATLILNKTVIFTHLKKLYFGSKGLDPLRLTLFGSLGLVLLLINLLGLKK